MTNRNTGVRDREIRLPNMPRESEAISDYERAGLRHARLEGDDLLFLEEDGLTVALRHGFFLLAVPESLELAGADRFCANFFESRGGSEDDLYRGYRDVEVPGDYQGYFDREHDQWENFYVERDNWGLLPEDVSRAGSDMAGVGLAVLRAVLRALDVPLSSWDQVSGGLTSDRGHQMLAFNHFRSDKAVRGCKFHRDSGWVTVLRSTDPGLLALIDDRLMAISPEPGHFIVNFGSSIEVLTSALPSPVRANVHGVTQTERTSGERDRLSYVVFLDSGLDRDIFRLEEGAAVRVESVAEFAVREVARTYDGDNTTL